MPIVTCPYCGKTVLVAIEPELVSVSELALHLGIHRSTAGRILGKWQAEGKLRPVFGRARLRRYCLRDIMQLLRDDAGRPDHILLRARRRKAHASPAGSSAGT